MVKQTYYCFLNWRLTLLQGHSTKCPLQNILWIITQHPLISILQYTLFTINQQAAYTNHSNGGSLSLSE